MKFVNSIYKLECGKLYEYKNLPIPVVFSVYNLRDPDTLYNLKILETLCRKYSHVLCYSISFESYRKFKKPFYRRDSYNIFVYQSGNQIHNIKEPTLDKLDPIFSDINSKCSSEMYEMWKKYKVFQEMRLGHIMSSYIIENAEKVISEFVYFHTERYLSEQIEFYNYKFNILKWCLINNYKTPLPYHLDIKKLHIHENQQNFHPSPKRTSDEISLIQKMPPIPTVSTFTSQNYYHNPFFSYPSHITYSNTAFYSNDSSLNYSEFLQNQNKYKQYFNSHCCFESLKIHSKGYLNKDNGYNNFNSSQKKYFKPIILKLNQSSLSKNDENLKYRPYKKAFNENTHNTNHKSLNDQRSFKYEPKEYAFKYFKKRECPIKYKDRNSFICESFINLSNDTKNYVANRPSVIQFSQNKDKSCSSEPDKKFNIDQQIIKDTALESAEITSKYDFLTKEKVMQQNQD